MTGLAVRPCAANAPAATGSGAPLSPAPFFARAPTHTAPLAPPRAATRVPYPASRPPNRYIRTNVLVRLYHFSRPLTP
jgi:hypothetical protein